MQEQPEFAITDVGQEAWRRFKAKYLVLSLVLISAAIVGVFFFPAAAGILVIPALLFYLVQSQVRQEFFQQFANANGFQFESEGQLDERYGKIFNLGHDPHVSDVVTGTYLGHALKLFLYQYTTGYGRSQSTWSFTVFEIDFGKSLPQVLLLRSKAGLMNEEWTRKGSDTNLKDLQLEGDFNKTYRSYVVPGQEVEALEILAPDIMEKLIELPHRYDIELAGSRLHVYATGTVSSKADLLEMFSVASIITAKIDPILSRMDLPVASPVVQSLAITSRGKSFVWQLMLLLVIFAVVVLIISIGIAVAAMLASHSH